jgi:hypothetical protein
MVNKDYFFWLAVLVRLIILYFVLIMMFTICEYWQFKCNEARAANKEAKWSEHALAVLRLIISELFAAISRLYQRFFVPPPKYDFRISNHRIKSRYQQDDDGVIKISQHRRPNNNYYGNTIRSYDSNDEFYSARSSNEFFEFNTPTWNEYSNGSVSSRYNDGSDLKNNNQTRLEGDNIYEEAQAPVNELRKKLAMLQSTGKKNTMISRQIRAEIVEKEKEAAVKTFKRKNPEYDNQYTTSFDFHGLHVNQMEYIACTFINHKLTGKQEITIITGRGLNSKNGISELKEASKRYFKSLGMKCEMRGNEGAFVVYSGN